MTLSVLSVNTVWRILNRLRKFKVCVHAKDGKANKVNKMDLSGCKCACIGQVFLDIVTKK